MTEQLKPGLVRRLLKTMHRYYPVLLPLTVVCILVNAIVSSIPSLFMQKVIAEVQNDYTSGDWSTAAKTIVPLVTTLAVLYVISLAASVAYNQMTAVMTQGTLKNLRTEMFANMQDLPIRYFDTHGHGDVMSYYTNDIDTLRQMLAQSFPQLLISATTVVTMLSIMLYLSIWMTLVEVGGLAIMLVITRKIGGKSANYFMKQQTQMAKTESFIEEMMNGQKVVKVFSHEEKSCEDFDRLNDTLFDVAGRANRYANTLGPILNNVGNVLYVFTATAGGIMLASGIQNVSFSGLAFTVAVFVPFLNMTKQFAGSINQVSHQINAVVMGMAGTARVFELLDEKKETDDGYVTLEKADAWYWRHPHGDGTVTSTPLAGDVRLFDVDFGYTPEKIVLHNISLYAEPGQKVAFVGATGAGKTTITNLLTRFYDIADGKIRYDGININKMKKGSLRRSLGMVLQDTHLFTGTVMDNIRYGRLDATDEECIQAAELVGADDFIERLPEGYNTMLTNDASNLSQGQRQMLSIARAAVADPPVMILDEATSSVDTRTEAIIQNGMDALMKGRTVFVIAHRLSTVRNSDVILVLDHGRIIERGTHEELLKEKGQYYQLYTGAFELE